MERLCINLHVSPTLKLSPLNVNNDKSGPDQIEYTNLGTLGQNIKVSAIFWHLFIIKESKNFPRPPPNNLFGGVETKSGYVGYIQVYMNVPTYLVAQNIHGPRFNTPRKSCSHLPNQNFVTFY